MDKATTLCTRPSSAQLATNIKEVKIAQKLFGQKKVISTATRDTYIKNGKKYIHP